MTLRLVSVDEVDFGAFTDAFNLAYSDYYVPITMSRPAFRALFDRDDIAPDASVVALEDGRIVGSGLLGIRDRAGWIGGMGVIPGKRRSGIGGAMMKHLIGQAQQRDLKSIDLEVIEANRGAYALYRALGFADRRFLLVLDRVPDQVSDILPDCQLHAASAHDMLAHYEPFHPVPNCWQRARPSLEGIGGLLEAWALSDRDDRLQAYALGYADTSAIRLLDLAEAPGAEAPRAALCLLAALHRAYPDAHASSYNVADNDPVLPAFEALGYTVSFRQIEMRLTL